MDLPIKIVIFNSYVKLPEGRSINTTYSKLLMPWSLRCQELNSRACAMAEQMILRQLLKEFEQQDEVGRNWWRVALDHVWVALPKDMLEFYQENLGQNVRLKPLWFMIKKGGLNHQKYGI